MCELLGVTSQYTWRFYVVNSSTGAIHKGLRHNTKFEISLNNQDKEEGYFDVPVVPVVLQT